ncbi:MAG TPA: cupin domain-containing protein [Candidatus Acidoferrales bacterium]|nr:cupin domain-containing protein [Candidatus Acidoferrales bacterium]
MMNRREMSKLLALAAGALATGSANTLSEELRTHTQGTSMRSSDSIDVHDLMSEPLAQMQNPEVTMLTLTLAPGATSHPHRHTGPVFAYILEGSILNQVDPEPAKTYHPGDFFYEPPMHVHRQFKNLSTTESAKVLAIEVREKDKEFTIDV